MPGIRDKTIVASETIEATNPETGEVEEKEIKVEKPTFSPETILRLEDKSKKLISKQELRFFVDNPEIAVLLDKQRLFKKVRLLH